MLFKIHTVYIFTLCLLVSSADNEGPDLGPKFATLIVFLKELFIRVDFEKKLADNKKHAKLPSM